MDTSTMQQNTANPPPPPPSNGDDATMGSADDWRQEVFDVTNVVGHQCVQCQNNRWADCDISTQMEGQRCTPCKIFGGENTRCDRAKISMNDALHKQAGNRANKDIPVPVSRQRLPRNPPYDKQKTSFDYDVVLNKTTQQQLTRPLSKEEKDAASKQVAKDRKKAAAPQPRRQYGPPGPLAGGGNSGAGRVTIAAGATIQVTTQDGGYQCFTNDRHHPVPLPANFDFVFQAGNGYDASGHSNFQGYGSPAPSGNGFNPFGRGGYGNNSGYHHQFRGGHQNQRGNRGAYQNRSQRFDGGHSNPQTNLQPPSSGRKRMKLGIDDSNETPPLFAQRPEPPKNVDTPHPVNDQSQLSREIRAESEADREAKKRTHEESADIVDRAREDMALKTSREAAEQVVDNAMRDMGMAPVAQQPQQQNEDPSTIPIPADEQEDEDMDFSQLREYPDDDESHGALGGALTGDMFD